MSGGGGSGGGSGGSGGVGLSDCPGLWQQVRTIPGNISVDFIRYR